ELQRRAGGDLGARLQELQPAGSARDELGGADAHGALPPRGRAQSGGATLFTATARRLWCCSSQCRPPSVGLRQITPGDLLQQLIWFKYRLAPRDTQKPWPTRCLTPARAPATATTNA